MRVKPYGRNLSESSRRYSPASSGTKAGTKLSGLGFASDVSEMA